MTNLARFNHLLFAAAVTGLSFFVTAEARASTCVVTSTADTNTAGTLRHCVGRTNANLDSAIQMSTPGWYELNSTLVFTRSTTVTGGVGVILLPGDLFSAVNLIQIGGACSPSCTGVSTVTLNDIEIAALGLNGVRGILVNPSSGLVADFLRMDGFHNGFDGGALRAALSSSVVLTNSELTDNSAARGAAIFSQARTLTVLDSTLADNAVTGDGGAIHVDASGSQPEVVTIDGCEFLRNDAAFNGGAVNVASVFNVTATISATDFIDNTAGSGGALSGAAPISGSYFQGNVASRGGALFLGSSSTLSQNTFNSNCAETGGAISFVAHTSTDLLVVNDSTFEKNRLVLTDNSSGGALAISGGAGTHVVANSTFYGNGATGAPPASRTSGGAIAVLDGAKLDLIHATLSANGANTGGGLYVKASTATVKSSVVSKSTGGNCSNNGSMFQSSSLSSDGTCGFSINSVDPLLLGPASNGGPTRTMRPQASSKLINSATCYRATDQRGLARPTIKCDIGSVEL